VAIVNYVREGVFVEIAALYIALESVVMLVNKKENKAMLS